MTIFGFLTANGAVLNSGLFGWVGGRIETRKASPSLRLKAKIEAMQIEIGKTGLK